MMENYMEARNHNLIGVSLALSVATDMSLPSDRQASSDRADMSDYLCSKYSPEEVAHFAWIAHQKTGLPVTAFYEGDEQGTEAHTQFWEVLGALMELGVAARCSGR